MKKYLATAVAVVMAAGMCLSFSACDSLLSAGNQEERKKITIEDVKSVKSEKVTAHEWEEAFSDTKFSNCKIEYKFSNRMFENRYGTITAADGKGRGEVFIDSDDEGYLMETTAEYYYAKKLDGETYYVKNGKKEWILYEGEDSFLLLSDFTVTTVLSEMFSKSFDGVTYSETEQGYVLRSSEEETAWVLKFSNRKLSAAYGVSEDDEMIFKFTYGGQIVTLPKLKQDENQGGNEDGAFT
jgi:hypothetical protein